ncbi:serine hydrolase [Candidatus Pacebacteria bacterium]|nr:serine hydrolase [Candidatus Paceibacterota bacterium]
MYNKGRNDRRLYVASFHDDIPNLAQGDLIPKRVVYTAPAHLTPRVVVWYSRPAFMLTFSLLLFGVSITAAGYSVFQGQSSLAATLAATEAVPPVGTVTPSATDFTYMAKVDGVDAAHYLVADLETGAVIAASDLNAQVPIASLTKLMTAVVAAKYIDLDSSVRVTQEKYVTTLVPRLEGTYKVSVQNLLQLLLSESSNEAAEVIASVLGRDIFIARMNEVGVAMGLSNTIFTDPSGLDDGNISSVSDMMRLLQYIHQNKSFILDLTADNEVSNTYTTGQFGDLMNFNYIDDVDFVAGKVGETLAAGQTSVSLHRVSVHDTDRLITIVLLGTQKRSEDTKLLISYVKDTF